MFKAVVFDLDGTLVNTIQDLSNSINLALKQNGYNVSYDIEQTKMLIGSGIKNLCRRALKPFDASEADVEKVFKSFNENYDKMQLENTKPYEGMVELLDYLKNKNFKLAVLSNKKYENTCTIVNHLFKENTFDVVYGKKEGIPLKPDTRAFYMVLEELKVKKEEVLYVGDSDTDMETAINASLCKVAVTYGYRDKAVLEKYKPDFMVDKPIDIKNIIENDV